MINKNLNKVKRLFKIQVRFEQNNIYVRENKKVFFDVSIDKILKGRLVFEIYSKFLPYTCNNFYNLCKGFKDKEGNIVSYKNTKLHKIIPGMLVQGGKLSEDNKLNYYGKLFYDENYIFSHEEFGTLSMANDGKDTNGSQFFITTSNCSWFDGKHVAFGKLILGTELLNMIELEGSLDGRTLTEVEITNCGVYEEYSEKDENNKIYQKIEGQDMFKH